MNEGFHQAGTLETTTSRGGLAGGGVRPNLYGMRRSCDACGRHKKKCDGERPCR